MDGYACNPRCCWEKQLDYEADFGGQNPDGTPAGSIWSLANWLKYGKDLILTTSQSGCARMASVVIDYIATTYNKTLKGEFRMSVHFPDSKV